MAKTKAQLTVEVLTLNYQLAELPSSQHRAGLAGLVLVVRWLERQPTFQDKVKNGAICCLTRLDDRGATLELNPAGVEILFDEIYAATVEEQERAQPLKNKQKEIIQPRREEERQETDAKGKQKTKKVYIYPVVVPRGSFLVDSSYDRSSDGKNGHWIKLWRDMVWSILRGVPATRKPFEARSDRAYCEDAANVWKQLVQPAEFTVDLPSTYFLGAQANNAENVPFKDRARFQFLLHFWLFATQIYVPAVVDNEGKRNFVGYALAIPDVAYLQWFCEEIVGILGDRSPELSGYRPRDCIVDLAMESALDLMKRLHDRLTQTTGEQSISSTVFGIDVIHTEKQGNNVRVLSVTRLNPEEEMLDEYAQIRGHYWSPLFRRQCLLNLINQQPWHNGFDALLCTLPYEQSIENDYFRRDVREKLKVLIEEAKQMDETATLNGSTTIEPLVFRLVSNYVNRKLKAKYDLEWKPEWKGLKNDELNQRPDYKKYAEMKAKVAKSAFLDIRSRTEQMDFVNYFVSSLCSVPQHMKSDDYVDLTKALYQETDKIRTLTLLALSANS
ncbi:type I-MYXAN CRISPR-associated protein Cmx8 [Leptolyngbya sp. 'hensonii']|uniref:type I-MYXAN CRISPR-associated protein Cmx8 n=1 Tax=Leptolyngbya sp. 'hensonii' TaxID=1922337 RepID=UPI0009503158|nr:type I-MYXAN CRISPR-associated protein Cmx8 [Leptolyngbya sp. 'hensonii']OLP20444.1 type I-MYXAN CRISPR-associated protein Cmx8 [Leptolyngbya sp. 'hensonii']